MGRSDCFFEERSGAAHLVDLHAAIEEQGVEVPVELAGLQPLHVEFVVTCDVEATHEFSIKEKAREFWAQLLSGNDACPTVTVYRNFLLNVKLSRRKISTTETVKYISTAWFNFYNDRFEVKNARRRDEVWL